MQHIHRSLSKSLPLDNRVILLGADVVFTDSCSGDSDGFTIVVVEMMRRSLVMEEPFAYYLSLVA